MTRHMPETIRRQQILDAARRCFIQKGYYETRMEDIAAEAELSKGGIYFHFKGKQEVFEALVRYEYEESASFLSQLTAEAPASYEDMFQTMARHYLELFAARPDYPRFMMVMGEMAGRDAQVRELLAALQNEFITYMARIVQTGIDAGALKPIDARATATLLKGIVDAVEVYMALGVHMDKERLLATGLEIVLNGLTRKPC